MKIPTVISKVVINYFRYLAGGVAVLVLILGYAFVLSPKLTEVQTSQVATRIKAEADLKAKQKYAADLKTSNEKFATALPANSLQTINGFMPSDPDFPGLMLTIKNIVTTSGLNLDSIAVGAGGQVAAASAAAAVPVTKSPAAPSIVKTQDVSITVSGGNSYDGFKKLLANFEASQRLFDVVSVSFSAGAPAGSTPGGASATTGGATWTLILRSYYLPTT